MASSYEILGVPRTATKEQIKKAYRKLSMLYHPDRPTGNNEKFMSIKSAYEQLITIEPEKVHQQYEHRHPPYTSIISSNITKKGNCEIYLSFKNISYIDSMGMDYTYKWTVYGMNGGYLEISKKDLASSGYKFILVFHPVIGSAVTKSFIFTDPRSGWEKFWYNIKRYFKWHT